MLRQSPCCQGCKTPCDEEFKKILDLQTSGLVIYLHTQNDSLVQSRSTEVLKNEHYVLHNTNKSDLNRPMFMSELSQYKTKCILCKMNIQKVRSLLDEITAIRGNEVLSKCLYCKKSNPTGKCKRCEYIVSKFLTITMKQREDRQNKFEQWLYKVKCFLKSLSEEKYICINKMTEVSSIADLEKLLNQLEALIPMGELDIRLFPEKSDIMNIILENKFLLHKIITNLKTEGFYNRYLKYDSLNMSASHINSACICKKILENIYQQDLMPSRSLVRDLIETEVETTKQSANEQTVKEAPAKLTESKKSNQINKSDELTRDKKVQEGKLKNDKENILVDKQNKKSPKVEKPKKHTITSEERLLSRMMKEREKEKKKLNNPIRSKKVKTMPNIGDLPELKIPSKHELTEQSSGNVIECGDQQPLYPIEMVKGNNILPIKFHNKNGDNGTVRPLFFKVKSLCAEDVSPFSLQSPTSIVTNKDVQLKEHIDAYNSMNDKPTKGVIYYQLSNKEFIDKGWTKLPLKKIMRKMNIYKMIPASPKFDWFERNKSKKQMFYGSGEKLAEIEESGCGKWYYINGTVALDYYKAKDLNTGQRYIIYSSGDEYDNGKRTPITVMASFDFVGNGVVFDHYGNMRLKYNQSEGIVIDEGIAPPGRWKWHTLNDPPVLQPVFIDTYDDNRNSCVKKLSDENKDNVIARKAANPEMLTIEIEKFVKEKANKLLQKFKPFQIRMKVVKINEQFSLRIIDQANIYVLFRDGQVSLKLNLGMLLLSDEIIDTDIVDVSQVTTPYDRYPPTSESMATIQNTLNRAKKIGKKRGVTEFPSLSLIAPKNEREDLLL